MATQPQVAKLQYFFQDSEGYGWTEKYFGAYDVSDVPGLVTQLKQFGQLRLPMLTKNVTMTWIRYQSAWPRDPYVIDLRNQTGFVGTYDSEDNNVSNAVLMRLERQGVGYNRIYFRGVPDELVHVNQFTPDAAWLAGFGPWHDYVINNGGIIVAAALDNPQAPINVTSLTQGHPKGFYAIPAPGTSFTKGQRYRFKGASAIGYNGVKTCVSDVLLSPAGAYQFGGAQPQQDNSVRDLVTATPIQRQFGPPTYAFWETLSQRSPGRFFGQRRGRARTVLSLRPGTPAGG